MKRVFVCLVLLAVSSIAETKGLKTVTVKDEAGNQVGLYKGSYALVIGAAEYNAGWSRLPSVIDEMQQVQRALESRGFTVTRVLNPNDDQLEGAFKDFIEKYGYDPDNRLLFFFSGHGYSRKKGEKGYLVPVDAPNPVNDEKGFLRKALPMSQILAWCRQMEAKHALFLFDSCFSGTVFKTKAIPKVPPHISSITARPVRQFITAGDAGEEVPAKSVFTLCFLRALRGDADLSKDGYITGSELGMYLNEQVMRYNAGQTPQYGKIMDPELDEGDFVFSVSEKVSEFIAETEPAREMPAPSAVPKEPEAAQVSPKVEKAMVSDAVYENVVELIRKHYYKPVTLDLSAKPDVNALLSQLDDGCKYLSPEECKDWDIEVKSSLVGIGSILAIKNGKLTVQSSFEDAPAFNAGVYSRDVITSIDGFRTDGMQLSDAVSRIRGRAGTKVKLTIQREGESDPINLEITRAQVKIPSVKGACMLTDSTGYVRIVSFTTEVVPEVKAAVTKLEDQGLKSLIIDLRNNTGGVLSSVIAVSELFIPKGCPIVSLREGATSKIQTLSSSTRPTFGDLPLVVLVDRVTASGGEVLASCLNEQRDAVLVGEKTFGKCTVQTVWNLDNGGAAIISSAQQLTSKGFDFSQGLIPAKAVNVSPEEWNRVVARRAQLENPGQYTTAEIAEYIDVVDLQLHEAMKQAAQLSVVTKKKGWFSR